ncbi:hypothetical protein FAGKG844_100182 [Frankia sp. AgKG'84/4]
MWRCPSRPRRPDVRSNPAERRWARRRRSGTRSYRPDTEQLPRLDRFGRYLSDTYLPWGFSSRFPVGRPRGGTRETTCVVCGIPAFGLLNRVCCGVWRAASS